MEKEEEEHLAMVEVRRRWRRQSTRAAALKAWKRNLPPQSW